ncbi:MAG TPA: hypothetical protein VGM74_11655 [Burkholderiaceae bacterium]|jgi:hypothetical protein
MSQSSLLGGARVAGHAKGKDVDALGPSDSSDSGSDVQGESVMPTAADQPDELGSMPVDRGTDSDAMGTGERGSATGRDGPDNADLLPTAIEQQRANADVESLADADRVDTDDVEGISADDDSDAEAPDDTLDERRPRRESRRQGPGR